MKNIVILCFAISMVLTACKSHPKEQTKTDNETDTVAIQVEQDSLLVPEKEMPDENMSLGIEDKIIKRISRIPEVQQRSEYIDSLTDHKHGLSYMVDKLEGDNPEYYVQVGYSGEIRFETYYYFYVDTTDWSVRIEDIIEGDVVSLKEWRKRSGSSIE